MDYVKNIPQPVQLAFAGVGAIYLASRVVSYVQLLLNLFVLSGTNLRKYGRPGSWAVVTGASDGLGKEYAKQLAAKGFNLVLVSRTQSKLEALAQEFKVETKILAMVCETLPIAYWPTHLLTRSGLFQGRCIGL